MIKPTPDTQDEVSNQEATDVKQEDTMKADVTDVKQEDTRKPDVTDVKQEVMADVKPIQDSEEHVMMIDTLPIQDSEGYATTYVKQEDTMNGDVTDVKQEDTMNADVTDVKQEDTMKADVTDVKQEDMADVKPIQDSEGHVMMIDTLPIQDSEGYVTTYVKQEDIMKADVKPNQDSEAHAMMIDTLPGDAEQPETASSFLPVTFPTMGEIVVKEEYSSDHVMPHLHREPTKGDQEISRLHAADSPYKCATCGLGFTSRDLLRRHEKIHAADIHYKCPTWDLRFGTRHILQRHAAADHSYKCAKCDFLCTSRSLKIHEKIHVKGRASKPKPKPSVESSQLSFVHAGKQLFKCPDCNFMFPSKASMSLHETWHAVQKPYQCATCGVRFKKISSLTTHEKIHVDDTTDSIICRFCRTKFQLKSTFRTIRDHTCGCQLLSL